MADGVDRLAAAFAGEPHRGGERLRQVADPAQPAAARAELVPGKVDADDVEAVGRQKAAQRVEILFRTGVAVTDGEADRARTARLVVERGDRSPRHAEAAQIDVHPCGSQTFSRQTTSPST